MSNEPAPSHAHADTKSAAIVQLNVGGVRYTTHLATLRSHPHSFLAQLFSKPIAAPRDAKDGSYFIDRNGSIFGIILDYLRTGTLVVPRDPVQYTILRREVGFYGLPIYSQIPNTQPSLWQSAPPRFRHARILVNEIDKHIEWEEGALPSNLKSKPIGEVVAFLSSKGYKITSEYVSRGSAGLTSIWMCKEEPYPGVDVPLEIRDPTPETLAAVTQSAAGRGMNGSYSQGNVSTEVARSPQHAEESVLDTARPNDANYDEAAAEMHNAEPSPDPHPHN